MKGIKEMKDEYLPPELTEDPDETRRKRREDYKMKYAYMAGQMSIAVEVLNLASATITSSVKIIQASAVTTVSAAETFKTSADTIKASSDTIKASAGVTESASKTMDGAAQVILDVRSKLKAQLAEDEKFIEGISIRDAEEDV
ncbi:MAG: hypothetical protein LBR54_02370 [Oscillospiraceae bacterium]|jgi:hypothetical protein|nr:hypothetical protein [Oscillospiraceae bacterium]